MSIFKSKISERIDFFERNYFKSLSRKQNKPEAFLELYKNLCIYFAGDISKYYGLGVTESRIYNAVSTLFLPFALKEDETNEKNTATNLRGIIYASVKSASQIIASEIPYLSELVEHESKDGTIYLLEISDTLKTPVIVKDQIKEDVLPGLKSIEESVSKSMSEQSGFFVNKIGELSGVIENKLQEISGGIDKKEVASSQSLENVLLEIRKKPEPIIIKDGETEKAIADLQEYVKNRMDSIDLLVGGIDFNPVINLAAAEITKPEIIVDIDNFKTAVKTEFSELIKYVRQVFSLITNQKEVWEFDVVYEDKLPVKIIATEQ